MCSIGRDRTHSGRSEDGLPLVWLTGAGGQLGRALTVLYPVPDSFRWLATTRDTLDLCDHAAVRAHLRRVEPAVVVNCAAYTAVDLAEEDVYHAELLNRELPRILAEETSRYGGLVIHISTDYVFGDAPSRAVPYTEDDATDPPNVYGVTKAAGEEALMLTTDRYYILRTAWLYGPMAWGRSFYRSIRQLHEGEASPLRVVTDEVGSPTSTWSLSRIIVALLEDHLHGHHTVPYGLYHAVCAGEVSRYTFAQKIVELCSKGHGSDVLPIRQDQLSRRARRPHYSALDSSRLDTLLPGMVPEWGDALAEIVEYDHTTAPPSTVTAERVRDAQSEGTEDSPMKG